MLNDYGFEEFEKTSYSDWIAQIEKDLKGTSIADISTNIGEGVVFSPFHNKEKENPIVEKNRRLIFRSPQLLNLTKPQAENKSIITELMNGADGVILDVDGRTDLNKILEGIYIDSCHLSFVSNDIITFHDKYCEWASSTEYDLKEVSGYLFDQSNTKGSSALNSYEQILTQKIELSNLKYICIDSEGVQGNDLTLQNEVSYLSAKMVYYINELLEKDFDLNKIVSSIFFRIAIKDDFFLEVAKIRTLRFIAAAILKEYGIADFSIPIHVSTNPLADMAMISNSSQVMAASLGGANSIDSGYQSIEGIPPRISRNILNILKEESQLDKSMNPLEGSYFMENLIEQTIVSSWAEFQSIEENGGYGFILKDELSGEKKEHI